MSLPQLVAFQWSCRTGVNNVVVDRAGLIWGGATNVDIFPGCFFSLWSKLHLVQHDACIVRALDFVAFEVEREIGSELCLFGPTTLAVTTLPL